MAIIEDGKGRGFISSVSTTNRLNVSSKSNPRIFYASREDGLAFNTTSVDTDAVAGDITCYLKNTSSTRNLFVKEIHVSSENAAMFKVWVVTGTAAGSNALTPTNLNLTSGRVAETLARGDGAITGLTTGGLIDTLRTAAGVHDFSLFEDALMLGENDAIAIEYDTGNTGAAEISIEFHYEDIGAN